MELDPVDIRILELLLENGRLSYRELAKKVGVTTPTISSKVEHLMDMGLIDGYTAVINPEMLDQMTILLTIECKPSDLQTVLDSLADREEARELYAVDGTRVFSKVTVKDQAHLNAFLEGLGKIPEISSYNYQTITRTVKEGPRGHAPRPSERCGQLLLLRQAHLRRPRQDQDGRQGPLPVLPELRQTLQGEVRQAQGQGGLIPRLRSTRTLTHVRCRGFLFTYVKRQSNDI